MEFKEIKNEITVTIDGEGIYSIIRLKKGSKSIAIVEDIERGPGWCPKTKKLRGIKYYHKEKNTGWSRGENYNLGARLEIHIANLKPLTKTPKVKRDFFGFAIAIDWQLQYE